MRVFEAANLVVSDQFVREPADKVVNEILKSKDKRFIITGGRGIGKSVVLYNMSNRGLGNDVQTIYNCPRCEIIPTQEPTAFFDSKTFDYYYELELADDVLHYIRSNYPLLFEKYFSEELKSVRSLIGNYIDQFNNGSYCNLVKINCNYNVDNLTANILEKFRKLMKIKKLNIAFDRFDSVNGSSEYAQKVYEKHFDLFDKVVLVSDDPDINKDELTKKGYNIKTITYGKDIAVLREIIKRRKSLYEKEKEYYRDKFTSDLFLGKMTQFDGNIKLMIESLFEYEDLYNCFDSYTKSEESILDSAIKYRQHSNEEIKKYLKPSQLYL